MKKEDFLKQLDSDNKFIARIERAVAKKDKKELARIDKDWERAEQKERRQFERETLKDW
jgi:hypothetical protein